MTRGYRQRVGALRGLSPLLAHLTTPWDILQHVMSNERMSHWGPTSGVSAEGPVDGAELPRDSDLLCVPAHPAVGPIGAGVELRRLSTGAVVAIGFSSPRRLVASLGPHQPWIGLPALLFSALADALRVDRVLIDPVLDPGTARWTAQHVRDAIEQVI
ncbi:hypothetical protein GXW83_08260 [Streptacidiphilus sp. PB12-B1b]|uniref:SAV_915 family protein n=1 Tax=Streptacidiphilus sp. PB12-B1b TaxID=2705012 RepID=UPI0015FA7AF2|nr:SAV_915 family protein [Streptacidiphilus sp. PB12-B1b]QMU75733.1 hypothetical protein GXW83_08260 [Streptacidiphilus sp. PB12-B1b]